MDEHPLAAKRIIFVVISVAVLVAALYGAYIFFTNNMNKKLSVPTALTVEEKMALLDQLASAPSSGTVSVSGKEKILNALQKTKSVATTTSSADKMDLLRSLAP